MTTLPDTALLDDDCRKALEAAARGEPFDVEALFKQLDPAVAEAQRQWAVDAGAWVAANTSCLDCGLCCQQGWRVDVAATDLERMSTATREKYVVMDPPDVALPNRGPGRNNVGVLRILETTPADDDGGGVGAGPKQRCACLNGAACTVYEERPEVCRTFPMGHQRCVQVRVAAGLPVGVAAP